MTRVNEPLSILSNGEPSAGLPVLYSFRRCPYAMRARLAIDGSKIAVELREVVLRDKPQEFLDASPKGTVPVLVLAESKVLEESLDIMKWATGMRKETCWPTLCGDQQIISDRRVEVTDGPFKDALDRYKYPNRYKGVDSLAERAKGAEFIKQLDRRLLEHPYLLGESFTFADAAILPFVRQFAHVDRNWFFSQDWHEVKRWLTEFLESERFQTIMKKYPQWKAGDVPLVFGQRAHQG